MKLRISAAIIAPVLCLACAPKPQPADLVVLGGTIHTLRSVDETVEALAARDGVVVAVGSEEDIRPLIGDETEVFHLAGAVAYPGFIDAHAHFLGVGRAEMQLRLQGLPTWESIVTEVAGAVGDADEGEWIFGRGWHQEKWDRVPDGAVEGLPTEAALSAVSPENPVMLTHASGHAVIVNARALELAGITAATPDPEGGQIVRNVDGRPTGVLRENAVSLLDDVLPDGDSGEVFRRMVEAATDACLAAGLTSFQDAGSTIRDADRFRRMAEDGELRIRLSLLLDEPNAVLEPELDRLRVIGAGNGFLTIRGIKRWIDGALGSHGAWLLEPYTDMPDSSGLNTESLKSMRETAQLAIEHGYQFCTHAIGDRANRETLDIYEAALAAHPEISDPRWRIEHAQHLDPADIPRFGELGIIASMQPTHCTSDGPWVAQRLGDARAASGAYMWRALIDSGAVIAAGTDAPVESVDPLATFRSAVTRRMADGRVFFPEQRMTREEALRSMTVNAAYAIYEEGVKGTLEPSKYADLTVLSGDLLTVPEDELDDVAVVATIVGGTVAWPRR